MIIDRAIQHHCIHVGQSIREAVEQIDRTAAQFVLCVGEDGTLAGVLTDGDVRRWLLRSEVADTREPVVRIINAAPVFARTSDEPESIRGLLSERIRFLPLVDERNHLVAIARGASAADGMRIEDTVIGPKAPAFVIAEVGINHNGSVERARELIGHARDAGVNAVKFQMRDLDSLYRNVSASSTTDEDLAVQYTLNLLRQFELTVDEMTMLFDCAREAGLIPLCTPWDLHSLGVLEDYGIPAYKVASADLTNHQLLKAVARTFRPMIVSTGMSNDREIEESVDVLKRAGAIYALLHCNSTYPAPYRDINLKFMNQLSRIGDCQIGYSGHERGYHVAVAAVALGARIVEKHITTDRALEGPDHKVSLLPREFTEMVQQIRTLEEALGQGERRVLNQGETMNRANLAKSLVVNRSVQAGDIFSEDMIEIRSPGRGVQPNRLNDLIGRTVQRAIAPGGYIYESDLEGEQIVARPHTFSRPWGVPVRWHDFKAILEKSNPGFLEFHLSVQDMEEDFESFLDAEYECGFVVHSPDTFHGDHLLDLSNPDPAYRDRSIEELQRVIDVTRRLRTHFKQPTDPLIVASLGGFTTDAPLTGRAISDRYEILAASLSRLDCDGVEIIGQTLPPFPWYFGGQLFLSLFVHAEDTAAFCAAQKLRLCLDVCHSKLTCNHFGRSFYEFVETTGPHTAHLHIADARGVDGEGLQIGEGDMDFHALADQLARVCPDASFIPEIWQGHRNDGEGFWLALQRLEPTGI